MWQYFYAHVAYHAVRIFPQNNRCKMACFLCIFSCLLPIPQLYVVSLERSSRACDQPLLSLAITSIVFTFFTIAFTVLFCILIPVPRAVKIGFHVFGVSSLIVGIMTVVYMFAAQEDCTVSVWELFFMTQISAYLTLGSLVFLAVMFPFWIINQAKKDIVLDPYSRTGICYEPVKCCTCLWHI